MKNKRFSTFLIIMAVLFGLIGCSNKGPAKLKSGSDITFYVTTDVHYLAKSLTDGGSAFQQFVNNGDGKELNYIYEIMDAFTSNIKKKKPDVLILSGDLTSNGEKESHLELSKRLREIKDAGTKVYVIPGNHDILNPYARSFKGDKQYNTDSITTEDFKNIYWDFGYKEAVSQDKASLSYLVEPSEDVWLLMLDSAQYENNVSLGHPQTDGRIAEATLKWIKQCSDLAKSKGAKLIAVMHHNLLDHSATINKGFTLNNSKEVLQLFQQCGINLTLSGHIHLQDIKSYNNEGNSIFDIATACLGVYPQKFGILKYSPKDGLNYNTDTVDVEGWSKEEKISDKNLNNFKQYSRDFYGTMQYSKIVSRLAMNDQYTTEELQLMGETYRELYLRYYEGAKDIITDEIRKSPGYKLWLASDAEAQKSNILRFLNIDGDKNNKLHISNVPN